MKLVTYFLVIVAVFGTMFASEVFAYEPIISGENMLQQIQDFKVKQQSLCSGTNCGNLSVCSCIVTFSDKSYDNGVGVSFKDDPKVARAELLEMYKDYNNETILYGAVRQVGSEEETKLWEVKANVNLATGACDLATSYIDPEHTVDPFPGHFEIGECKAKIRQSCCCDRSVAKSSVAYSRCSAVVVDYGNANVLCGGGQVLAYDDKSCKTYEGKVEPIAGAQKPKGEEAKISIKVENLKVRAKELDKLGVETPTALIQRVINGLMAFMGTILFTLYVYAGFLWIIAAGNEEQIAKAKNILVWSTLGVAVIMGSYVIVTFLFGTLLKV